MRGEQWCNIDNDSSVSRAAARLACCVMAVLLCVVALGGCGSAGHKVESSSSSQVAVGEGSSASESLSGSESGSEQDSESQEAVGSDSSSSTGGWGLVSDEMIEDIKGYYEEAEGAVRDELEDRKTATPTHVELGEEVEVTDNLAVSVLSVEPGPYDYADDGPTVKVTVAMRNLTDKTLMVKASNWDADNTSGQRVDHKLYVKDESGERNTRSFEPTKVSPRATFTGVLYFDGEDLVSVIYEPHWLVSAENQYVYFDL